MIRLYGKKDCHLCDEARSMLSGISAEYLDISEDFSLLARYGLRIPVIARSDGAELDWPFDREELNRFLAQALHAPDQ